MTPEGQTPSSGSNPELINYSCGDVRPFQWSPDAVCRLDEEVDWAFTSNPTGAAEVAGVLLGKSSPTIHVTGCQPVFLMHPTDRAYALAGPGKREFERTIAAFRSNPENGLSVVGFYRSHIGDRFDLTEEDLDLVGTCFPDTGQVFLLIELTQDRSSRAKLYSGAQCQSVCEFLPRENASAVPRWLELWRQLSAERPPDTAAPSDTAGLPEISESPDTASVSTEQPVELAEFVGSPIQETKERQEGPAAFKRFSNRSPLLLLAAAATLAVLVAYPMFKGPARSKQGGETSEMAALQARSRNSHSSGLALRVERNGDGLRLDWDRSSPVLVGATGGILTIRQGRAKGKEVMLDENLLRSGAVVYRPVRGDVFLRLVIFDQAGTKLGESATSFPQRMSTTRRDPQKETK